MCGEKRRFRRFTTILSGSPPRVRGKVGYRWVFADDYRITPACAGKSASRCLYYLSWGDHPRVCGEKQDAGSACKQIVGSPPRVRGKVFAVCDSRRLRRITPACAGKSRCGHTAPRRRRDHPRVCGEKGSRNFLTSLYWGSPPRVRGKELIAATAIVRAGITPACAGKRLKKALKNKDF